MTITGGTIRATPLGVFKTSSLSHDPSSCSYVGEPARVNDPVPTLRITLRLRSGRTDLVPRDGGDTVSEEVSRLGATAVWVTANGNGTTSPERPATTASTAPGTPNRTSGRLMVSPPGYLIIVKVSGMYNNPEEAKLAAQLILDRL